MQKVFCFELQFFYSSYKPLGYKLFFFRKKKLTTPYPFEVCSWVVSGTLW